MVKLCDGCITVGEKQQQKSIKPAKSNIPCNLSLSVYEGSADKQDRMWCEGLSAGVGGGLMTQTHAFDWLHNLMCAKSLRARPHSPRALQTAKKQPDVSATTRLYVCTKGTACRRCLGLFVRPVSVVTMQNPRLNHRELSEEISLNF